MSGTYTPPEGKGNLFKNRDKKGDNHPDWRGTAMINGVLHEVSAWDNDRGKGPYLSLQIKPAQQRDAQPQREAPKPEPRGSGSLDDEVPFAACKE